MHIEFLLEEPSAEAFLAGFLSKVLPQGTSWSLIVFQGKHDLLNNLASRLKGYRHWLPEDWRIVVLVDEDRQDCLALKARLEEAARKARLTTKSSSSGNRFSVLNRIAIEELEAWFFGDVPALRKAFPRVPASLGAQAKYRNSDAISGGTWECLERVLQRAGHYSAGMPKIEVARIMAMHMVPSRNTSKSFRVFLSGLASIHTK